MAVTPKGYSRVPSTVQECEEQILLILNDIDYIEKKTAPLIHLSKEDRTPKEHEEFCRLRVAKGIRERRITWLGALRNTLRKAEHEALMAAQQEKAQARRDHNRQVSYDRAHYIIQALRRFVSQEQFEKICEEANLAFKLESQHDTQ